MEKITKYFKYDYENDTTIEYVNTGLYSMLNCSFTSEDPDYGTDTLHWTSSKPVPIAQIAYEMKNRLSGYLNRTDDGIYRKADDSDNYLFGDYSNSTLYAIEKALHEIAEGYRIEEYEKEGN